jgi:hypothetical protein
MPYSKPKEIEQMRFALIALICAQTWAQPAPNIVSQRGDNTRTGANLLEKQLTPQSVKAHFGKLWTLFSDAKIMAQPLYVSNLKSAKCPGGCNTVIFCSMKGTIYAYKADQKPTTINDTLVWARYLGDPRPGGGDIDAWATDDPWWGILGTPAIDLTNNLIYVVAWNPDQNYRLYAVSLFDGNIAKGPAVIQGSIGGQSFVETRPGWTQQHKQRAGLTLDHGSVYVAFGGDNGRVQSGWMFVYDAGTLAFKAVWSPTPGGSEGGIWMSGNGPLADDKGNIYLITGNGEFNPSKNRFGDSLVKLSLTGSGGTTTVTVADSFTPCNQAHLAGPGDLDLGSSSPIFLGNLIAGGGKDGIIYLMNRDHLAGFQPGAPANPPGNPGCNDTPQLLQRVNATDGHIHGAPVFWKGPNGASWVYVMGEGDNLKAFPFKNERFLTGAADVKKSTWRPPHPAPANCAGTPDNWMPGGIIGVSSDADKQGTGIVWALVPANGDANTYRGVKGMLLALNAENVSQELWRSQGANSPDDTANSFGLLARFNPPTIANGKVFVATAGDKEELKRYAGFGNQPCGPRPTPQQFPANFGLVVYGLK